ncbi:hypothetical protein ABES09_17000 [Priestia megaterium]
MTRHPVETIYYLENPQRDISTYASTTQLTVESVVKDVFGVACVADIKIMLQYNKEFRKSISQLHNAMDDDLTLEMVFRIASKEDLLRFKKSLLESSLDDAETSIDCPFNCKTVVIRGMNPLPCTKNKKNAFHLKLLFFMYEKSLYLNSLLKIQAFWNLSYIFTFILKNN